MHPNRNRPFVPWLLAALALMLAAPATLHAADWAYRVRPGDNIWDLSNRYLKPGISWQRLQDLNHVDDPRHLPPGMRLRIPVSWLRVQPAKARVVAVYGNAVTQAGARSPAMPVQAGMELGFGATLHTDAEASLTLEFADGSRLLMQGDSELQLDKLSAYGKTGMATTRLMLRRGRISSDVKHFEGVEHFSVMAPGAISSVRGTQFRVAADADAQRSQTEVLAGGVDVKGAHRHARVKAGMGIAVGLGTQGRPQPLLDAPALQCPQQPIRSTAHELTWPALPSALRYRLQIAPDQRFQIVMIDRVVDHAGATLPELPDGSYAIRVHGIDAQQLEGRDAVCTVSIDTHPVPPLVIEPQPGQKMRQGRPRFRWTENTEAASYAWQLASSPDFSRPISDQQTVTGTTLRAPRELPDGHYFWRIATRDRSGELGPYSDPIPFERVAEPPAPEIQPPARSRRHLAFSWKAGQAGQHYRVQLAHAPDFGDTVLDRTVDQPSLQIPKPGAGTWYLRVRTIDNDGYEGPWSPAQKIKVPCIVCRFVAGGAAAWLLLAL